MRFIFLLAIAPAMPTVARMANGNSGRQLPELAVDGAAVGVAVTTDVGVAVGATVTMGAGVAAPGRGTVKSV